MLNLLTKIPLYKCFRSAGLPPMLPLSLTVGLTYNCNSRCKTCRIYTRQCEELSITEYEKIFKSIGRSPYWVTFSGGEPFLRTDIQEICVRLYENCRPKIINIPTNGLLTERIEREVKSIADACSESEIIVNLSIDSIGGRHDEIRGVKGAFDKVTETFRRLRGINRKNLTLGIHTVISKFNVHDLPEIYTELKKLGPDSYITEIAEERVELQTVNSGITPSLPDYAAAVDFISDDMIHWEMKGISRITRAFRRRYYNLVKSILAEKRMFIPCYAGYASCQIAPDGEVWACCIKAESMGNLRLADYDFKTIWFSEAARDIRKAIKKRECFCPLANTSYTNMLFSFRTLARVFREIVICK